MHACIVRINCQNKWAGVNPQLLACNCICAVAIGTATNVCVSVSSKDTGPCPQRWCSNEKLSAINWPALQRLSFSVVICFVEAVIPSSIGIAHFSTTQYFRSAAEKFWRKGKPIVAQPDRCQIERRTLGGLGDISVLDGHGS